MTDLLAHLNPVQRAAVEHGEGPLLILAGAGSGKTRVVTHRIARLLRDGVAPESVLAMTFTNRAAREMRERIVELLGEEGAAGLTVSTFHSLGARFLRRHAAYFTRSGGFTIYDDGDQEALIRQALTRNGVEDRGPAVKAVARAIDRAKNAGRPADEMELDAEHLYLEGLGLGALYDELLARADAFDFGDLILRPAELLEASEETRARYQARWRWVLVDEFQDTNAAQYRWLQALAPPGANLCVVGDDDQSIYGWRGAEVGNILQFPEAYAGATVLRLEQNYRSTGHILDAANGVIAHNRRRLGKSLWTDRGEGTRLEIHEARDGREEARWVAGRIAALCRDEGRAPGEVAVLMRANHLSLDLEQALQLVGIRYSVVRGRSFYDRAEVRDALAYVRVLVNPHDDVAFLRAVNTPSRGVGRTSLERLLEFAGARGGSLWSSWRAAVDEGAVKGKARAGLAAFAEVLAAGHADQRPPAARVGEVLRAAGLLADLESEAVLGEEERQRLENVQRLLAALRDYEQEVPGATLAGFLERVQLVTELDAAELEGGSVSMMTVHAAKGLEFPIVFVMGLEEGLFPHARAAEDDVEEERRLCYVALTRARERLFLSRAHQRRTFNEVRYNPPSRFLAEIPADNIETRYVPEPPARSLSWRPTARRTREASASDDHLYRDAFYDEDGGGDEAGQLRRGMKVWHAEYGAGEVLKVSRGGLRPTVVVDFPDVGPQTVVARFLSVYDG